MVIENRTKCGIIFLETWEVTQFLPMALKCDATSATSSSNGIAEVQPTKEQAQPPLHRNYFRIVAFGYVLPSAALVCLCLPC